MKHGQNRPYTGGNFRLNLLLWSSIYLLLIKIFLAAKYSTDTYFLFAGSYVQDVFIMLLLYLVSNRTGKHSKIVQKFAGAVYATVLMFFLIACRIYSKHVPDLMDFPVNIFGVQTGTANFLIEYFLEPAFIVEILSAAGALLLLSVYCSIRLRQGVARAGLMMITLLFILSLTGPLINPILNSVYNEISGRCSKSYGITPLGEKENMQKVHRDTFPEMIRETKGPTSNLLRYNKILVMVMESVNYHDFVEARKNESQDFINKYEDRMRSYQNYYSSNLDSYTGLLVMLNSVMIPYQAYVSEDRYHFVNNRSNLVREPKANGFHTFFLTSYGEQQKRFVPDFRDWQEVKCLEKFPESFTSVSSVKIERASEDLSVLTYLTKALRKNRKIFLFQELVFGHTREWKAKTGRGSIDYYNHYFQAVFDSLKKDNLSDSTLIVITSDHGPRQGQTNPENYRVPLIFWASDMEKSKQKSFLSHIDFKEILLHESGVSAPPVERQKLFTIGNSGNLHYGMIDHAGNYIFIDDRLGRVYTNQGQEEVRNFHSSFKNYRTCFDRLKRENQDSRDERFFKK